MAKKSNSPAMDFIIAQLEKEPEIEYRTVKDRAERKSLTVYPIMYGKAKAMLGLVPTKKRSRKKGASRSESTSPRGAAPSHGNGTVADFEGQLVRAITDIQEQATSDSKRLRDAIRKAIEMLQAALDK